MLRYKIDVLQALRDKGFSGYKLFKSSVLGQATMNKILHGEPVKLLTIEKICDLLECQPGNIIEFIEDEDNENAEI